MDLVSILMPNYNYAQYIEKAIESALNQTYENIELIIVDDASTDRSLELAQPYADRDERVRLFRNERNLGSVGNHNRTVELSRGRYIVVLSSDDYIAPTFVEECMNKLKEYPTAGMAACAMYVADEKGNVTQPANYYGSSFICKGIYQCKVFLMSNTFVPSQVLFRRECIEDPRVGGAFSEAAGPFIDTDLWYRICLYYDFLYFDRRLCYYRVHMGSDSRSFENLRGVMHYYLLRQRFITLARGNEYLLQYGDEAMRRTPLNCIRTIRVLIEKGEFRSAKRYLRLAEALDLDIAESDYYRVITRIIDNGSLDDEKRLHLAEGSYLDSLKSETSRGVTNTAPYALPDGAMLIESDEKGAF